MALLAWRLATDLDWDGRQRYFKITRAIPENHSWLTKFKHRLNYELNILDRQIDKHLPHDRFQIDPSFKEVAGPDPVEVNDVLGMRWRRSLAIVPLLQWLQTVERSDSGIWRQVRRVLSNPASGAHGSPGLSRWLAPNWQGLLKACEEEADDRYEAFGINLKPYFMLLVKDLATLPYDEREDLIRALGLLVKDLRSHAGSPGNGDVSGDIAHESDSPDGAFQHVADNLRRAIAQYRFSCRGYAEPTARRDPERPDSPSAIGPRPHAADQAPAIRTAMLIALGPVEVTEVLPLDVTKPKHEIVADAGLAPPPESAPPPPRLAPARAEPARVARTPRLIDTSAVGVSWAGAREDAQSISVAEIRELIDLPLLFEDCLIEKGRRVVHVRDRASVPAMLWYIGDLHGDLLALASAWAYIQAQAQAAGQKPYVLFLGDFVDRGAYGHETLLFLFRMIRDHRGQIGVLPGNHDEISWQETEQQFRSEVSPAEYTGELNAILKRGQRDQEDHDRVELGKLACTFFARRARAVFLPDGLLVAHAGFPHSDLLQSLNTPDDLNAPECLQDFLWLRISDNAPRKRPNRGTKGCEFGFDNFSEFCKRATGTLGILTRRLLRGHEHPPARYATYPKYVENEVVTINTMCRRLEDESSLRVEQFPRACVARHVPDELPEIHRILIEPAEIRAAYFADSERSSPARVEKVPTPSGPAENTS
jgi:hypothetical protein